MPEQDRTDRFIQAFPKYLLLFTILFLVTIYVLVWLIDFRQVYVPGLTEWKDQFPAQIFWLHTFREAGIIENFQWLFLGLSVLISFLILMKLPESKAKVKWGWMFLTLGLFLMLLEDSINIRHILSYHFSIHFYDGSVGSLEWQRSGLRTAVEMSFYTFLGSIMLSAFYIIYRYKIDKSSFIYLTIGFVVYGISGFTSATRNIGNWYEIVGIKILYTLTEGLNLSWNADSIIIYQRPLGFYFMDYVVEESLELIGATLILCALISVIQNKIAPK